MSKQPLMWLGHPVRDSEHINSLELNAAINQYHHGMSRADAEARVKDEDRRDRHLRAAAHHFEGLRAANAVGSEDDAKRHHEMYSMHLRVLGLEPNGPVPIEIQRYRDAETHRRAYAYKGHSDDQLLVDGAKKNVGDR